MAENLSSRFKIGKLQQGVTANINDYDNLISKLKAAFGGDSYNFEGLDENLRNNKVAQAQHLINKFASNYGNSDFGGGIKVDGILGNQTYGSLNFLNNLLKTNPEIFNDPRNMSIGAKNNGQPLIPRVATPTFNPITKISNRGIESDMLLNENDFKNNFKGKTGQEVWNFLTTAPEGEKYKAFFGVGGPQGMNQSSFLNYFKQNFGSHFGKHNYRDLYKANQNQYNQYVGQMWDINNTLMNYYNNDNNLSDSELNSLIDTYKDDKSKTILGALMSKYRLKGNENTGYQLYDANTPGIGDNSSDYITLNDWYNNRNKKNQDSNTQLESAKNGSKLNYMTQKYQAGGAAPQGDPQQQIIQLVQAAMGGDQQATAQIQQIMQAAQQGDQQAAQLAEVIMQVMNQMQGGGPQVARNGAKLNYIKRLKGECPEGYEMAYFKAGGRVCKKCQKKVEKACGGKQLAKCGTKFHKAGGIMESILSEMFAKGGRMNRNKHTAFGEERGVNVVSTNHAGRWGGRRAFNANGTHNLNPHDKPNKFSAFGDEGKKKPTNVGLVGHKATGKTGRMQNRQKAGTTYKATAFGGEKQKRFHRGAKASSIGRIGSNGYPKGHGGKSGIGKMADGGSLNGVPFYQGGTPKKGIIYRRRETKNVTPFNKEEISYYSPENRIGVMRNIVHPNDTVYSAVMYEPNGAQRGYVQEWIKNGKVDRGIIYNNNIISPSDIKKGQFKTWRDYFEYLNKLPRTVTPRK